MKPVLREEILDFVTYGERRDAIREEIMALKRVRRIHVGEYLTFLFENHDTARYQVLEMVRAEQMVRDADIQHELETYNELLGKPGELGCTLLIEVTNEKERDLKLTLWLELPAHLYARLEDGTLVRPTFDERQVGADRLSSVQFLKFDTDGRVPLALGSDLPALRCEARLAESQRKALAADLASEPSPDSVADPVV